MICRPPDSVSPRKVEIRFARTLPIAMWHAARRGVRAAASNASAASLARTVCGDAGVSASHVSWRAGALAGRADHHHAFSTASAAAWAKGRAATTPGDFSRAPLALRAAHSLLHAGSGSSGNAYGKEGKEGYKKEYKAKDGKYGKTKESGESKLGNKDDGVYGSGSEQTGASSILNSLLASSKAIAVREDLDAIASCVPTEALEGMSDVPHEPRSHLSLDEFDSLLTEHGFADTKQKQHITAAFRDAGVIIQLEDIIYLNATQVTKDILRTLPAVPSSVYGMQPQTLVEVEQELAAMKLEIDAAAARAKRRSKFIVFAGLLTLCAQLATFMRLTYVELSWDVMEPISYFVGVFNAILMYTYFMVNNRDFSFNDWSNRMQNHFWKKTIQHKHIDVGRYAKLMKRLRRKR